MRMKRFCIGLMAALILFANGGCKKSSSDTGQSQSQIQNPKSKIPSQTFLSRVHWLGKNRIAAETNAARFMSLWNLPESARLETQTLDKLAVAMTGEPPLVVTNPVSAAGSPPPKTNQPPVSLLSTINQPLSTKLRPLLEDLVRHEWYLEIQQGETSLPGAEVALAIRLDEPRASLWTSNLAAVLGSLTNVQALPAPASGHAWILPGWHSSLSPELGKDAFHRVPDSARNERDAVERVLTNFRLDLARAGDWTLVGLARERNTRLDDFAARIQRDHTPVAGAEAAGSLQMEPISRKVRPAPGSPAEPNLWLEADLDLPRISSALALGLELARHFPQSFPGRRRRRAGRAHAREAGFFRAPAARNGGLEHPHQFHPRPPHRLRRRPRHPPVAQVPWWRRRLACEQRSRDGSGSNAHSRDACATKGRPPPPWHAAQPGLLLGARGLPDCIFWPCPRRRPATRCTS